MFIINEEKKQFSIENNSLNLICSYENGLGTLCLNNLYSEVTSNKNLSFFSLSTHEKTLTAKDFNVESVLGAKDFSSELITVLMKNEESGISLRLHFLSNNKDTIEIIFQFKEDLKTEAPSSVAFHSPFLANLSFGGDNDSVYYPGAPAKTSNGENVMRFPEESFIASDMKLPLVVCGRESGLGFSVSFPFSSNLIDCGSAQNRDIYFTSIKNIAELKKNSVGLALSDIFNDSVVFSVTGIKGGFNEAFERTRKDFLSNYDFSLYNSETQNSFRRCAVNGFVFLYGSSFDKKLQKIDTKKIINEGKAFGGYDTVTLWNAYPRLGVDGRSQWDFFDDFPGGRAAIKTAVVELHRENIKVFLPFLPWDRKEDESDSDMADKLIKLLSDIDADGVQLDTLDRLPLIFFKKLKSLKRDVILMSQLHPANGKPLERITTSWDEFFEPISMPKINLSRFLVPSHITPAASRWARCEEKDELINYSLFNAEPIVVWEDVFGRNLPFSGEQKAKIAAWRKTYLENNDVFCGNNPLPLYKTENPNIFCNLFRSDNYKEFIYCLYNDGEIPFSGKVLKLFEGFGKIAECLLGTTSPYIKSSYLYCDIKPKTVVQIKVKL